MRARRASHGVSVGLQAGVTGGVSRSWNTAGSAATEDMPRKPRRLARQVASPPPRESARKPWAAPKSRFNQEAAAETAFTDTARESAPLKPFWPLRRRSRGSDIPQATRRAAQPEEPMPQAWAERVKRRQAERVAKRRGQRAEGQVPEGDRRACPGYPGSTRCP